MAKAQAKNEMPTEESKLAPEADASVAVAEETPAEASAATVPETKEAAAKDEPAKDEPAKETPAKANRPKETPVKQKPAKESPSKPAKATAAASSPKKESPTRSKKAGSAAKNGSLLPSEHQLEHLKAAVLAAGSSDNLLEILQHVEEAGGKAAVEESIEAYRVLKTVLEE
ncbi:hypothetical protein RMSM_05111 [Rhodopirellula maiorica SM1]|uniref:Uncharacterized protein n=2 Tax=Novipirellula TaxID=2795426 RepID=M5RFT8_9BACT|nr:hypothetical protein RMSM_05111 [Rhodopirellula maiorica SM1]